MTFKQASPSVQNHINDQCGVEFPFKHKIETRDQEQQEEMPEAHIHTHGLSVIYRLHFMYDITQRSPCICRNARPVMY